MKTRAFAGFVVVALACAAGLAMLSFQVETTVVAKKGSIDVYELTVHTKGLASQQFDAI
jgi:hypothetical protein